MSDNVYSEVSYSCNPERREPIYLLYPRVFYRQSKIRRNVTQSQRKE